MQCSVYRIKNTILFYIDNFEKSNLDIIDSPCGLHVQCCLDENEVFLDDLKQVTIYVWDVKKKLFLLSFLFPDLQNTLTIRI